ncbi:serine hydrolase domain-containing protein [Streptomyces sp. NPDC090106]|uniref:serine hydrolase domain-containing protein n=1 Tax=Streptomyces sp. NPDC090106 TaxID=3365946 RepID=UPI0037F99356
MFAHRSSRRSRIARGALALGLVTCTSAMLMGCSQPSAHAADAGNSAATSADRRLAVLAQTAADTGSLGVIVRVDNGTGTAVEIARQAAWTKADHRLAAGDLFRVGSNTKPLTATLVLQQVADGRIGLDDTVEKWLPGLVGGGDDITVRMLLNHTSGLGDFLLTPEFLGSLMGQEQRTWTPEELLAITPEQDPPTAPGEHYSYSNTNYEALGLILEKATGRSLSKLIEEKITKPLGMKNTYLATNAAWPARKQHVTGYEPDAERLKEILSGVTDLPDGVGFAGPERPDDNVETSAIDPSWSWAAGGMVSTAHDWQKFLSALMSGRLVPEAQMKEMRTTVDAPEERGRYGLGLMQVSTPCGTVWGHTGGLPGYSSEIYSDADGRRSVAVLTSTNFGIKEEAAAAANKDLTDAAICQMLGKPQPSESPAG